MRQCGPLPLGLLSVARQKVTKNVFKGRDFDFPPLKYPLLETTKEGLRPLFDLPGEFDVRIAASGAFLLWLQ